MLRNPCNPPIDWFDIILDNMLTKHTWSEALADVLQLSRDLFSLKFKKERLTTGVKFSILQQTHLRILNHEEKARLFQVSPVLMFAQVEHILIGSILVAMKIDQDLFYVRNGFSTHYWNNVNPNFTLEALNKIERWHLKLCDYTVALTPQKLEPIFQQYADKEALNLLTLELSNFTHEIFQHNMENEILGMVQTQLYNLIHNEKAIHKTFEIPKPTIPDKNNFTVKYPDKIGGACQIAKTHKFKPLQIASGMINANAIALSDKAWKLILKSTEADLRKKINHKHYLSFWHTKFTLCANIVIKNKIININTGDDESLLILIKQPAPNHTIEKPVTYSLDNYTTITTTPIKEGFKAFLVTASNELLKKYRIKAKQSHCTVHTLMSNIMQSHQDKTPDEIALKLALNDDETSVDNNISVIITPVEMNNVLPIYAAVFDGPASNLLSSLFHRCLEENIATILKLAINGQHDLQAISLLPTTPAHGLYL